MPGLGKGYGIGLSRSPVDITPSNIINPLTYNPNILALWAPSLQATYDGSNGISSIAGQVGGEGDLVQVTPTRRPLYVPEGLNGKATATFDSFNAEWMVSNQASSIWKFLHDGTAYTVYRVVKNNSAAGTEVFMGTHDSSAESGFLWFDSITGTTTTYRIGSGTAAVVIASTSAHTLGWRVEAITYQAGLPGDDLNLYLNGVNNASGDQLAAPGSANPKYTLNLGRRGANDLFWNGEIAEIIISRGVDDVSMRAAYFLYLKTKYII